MEKYKYIIIDDEYPSHLTVQQHFKSFSRYNCAATFLNPKQAFLFLQTEKVDLIFLDIEMPEMNGFQFLETLEKKIFVVILTAYPERYGVAAHQYYDKDLVFFSNKAQFSYYFPKIRERFEKMYEEKKVLNIVHQLSKNEIHIFPNKINKKTISLEDIIYIKVEGHNIILTMINGKELNYRMALRELLGILPAHIFFQITRNIVINIGYVASFTNSTVCIENQHLIISSRNRKKVIQRLKAQRERLNQIND
jgi:DNA-binding LytR/AlgR family response regulator